jgi:hypothetical protein
MPGGERVADSRDLVAEASLREAWHQLLSIRRRDDVDAQVPALPGRELDAIRDPSGLLDSTLAGEDHLRLSGDAGLVSEQELVVLLVVAHLDEWRQRSCMRRVAEREVVVLDGEDVREVARHLDRKVEGDRPHALVLDPEVVLHRLAHEALADHRDLVLFEPLARLVSQVERRREVVDLARREQQRSPPVDAQAEDREEARVVGEEAARWPAADVAQLVADAEGRALEDRDRQPTAPVFHGGSDLRCFVQAP